MKRYRGNPQPWRKISHYQRSYWVKRYIVLKMCLLDRAYQKMMKGIPFGM